MPALHSASHKTRISSCHNLVRSLLDIEYAAKQEPYSKMSLIDVLWQIYRHNQHEGAVSPEMMRDRAILELVRENLLGEMLGAA